MRQGSASHKALQAARSAGPSVPQDEQEVRNAAVSRDGSSEDDAPRAQQIHNPAVTASAARALKPASQEQSRGPTAEEVRVARILVSANGVSSYHGRTSTLFEDSNPPDRPAGSDCRPRMSDEWVERGLVAEAVRQCKLRAPVLRASCSDAIDDTPCPISIVTERVYRPIGRA